MPPPRRQARATFEETSNPPTQLEVNQAIARVVKAEGKNLYTVERADSKLLLVELPARFRSTIWMKRGGYVMIDTSAFEKRDNKLEGEIVNVVTDEKYWRKQAFWPPEFVKKPSYPEESDEESTVGKFPPDEESEVEE